MPKVIINCKRFGKVHAMALEVCQNAALGHKTLVIVSDSGNFVRLVRDITGGPWPEGVTVREAIYGNSN